MQRSAIPGRPRQTDPADQDLRARIDTSHAKIEQLTRSLDRIRRISRLLGLISRRRPRDFARHNRSSGSELIDCETSLGPIVTRDDAPRLIAVLAEAAKQTGIRPPQEVRLTYLPACALVSRNSSGRRNPVLLVGLPCFYAWCESEWLAVLTHEIAHCYFQDIARCQPFTEEMSQFVDLFGWFRPRFHSLFCELSRQIEFRADDMSVLLCGRRPLVAALARLASVQVLFDEIIRQAFEHFSESNTIYSRLASVCRRLNGVGIERILENLPRRSQNTPRDTPTVLERLQRLQFDAEDVAGNSDTTADWLANRPAMELALHNRLFAEHPRERSIFAKAKAE